MNEIHVKIAEVKIGRSGDLLKATLGSCIGVAFIWREKGICGLAHCFLPETESEQYEMGAKYVNQAIASLMKLMSIRKENIHEIDVYLAGAGNMMNQLLKSNKSQIGKHNAEAAHKYLAELGFRIKYESLGANSGSKILVNCTEMNVQIVLLEDLNVYAWKA